MPKKQKLSLKSKNLGDSDELFSHSPPQKEKFIYPEKNECLKKIQKYLMKKKKKNYLAMKIIAIYLIKKKR